MIQKLNNESTVHGILIVQPLKSIDDINVRNVIEAIKPCKDVEGMRYSNLEMLEKGQSKCIVPPSAAACLALIKAMSVQLPGKHAAVITKQSSELAMMQGNPTVQLLRREGCIVTYIDPDTENAQSASLLADIVIAMDRPEQNQINKEWIKDGAVVIDASFGKSADGKPMGYVDTKDVSAKWVTPVPGGFGPVHVACELANTVRCANNQHD
jgi:methylenetetrahydrofolate dehydrogenase (NADP+)/methenyltetrahydrofolate cyclohydrolase